MAGAPGEAQQRPPLLLDGEGREAKAGESLGYWLGANDFVASDPLEAVDAEGLLRLGFPRDWPAIYSTSQGLKALVGKRGRIPAKRVAVAGAPTAEQRAQVPAGVQFHPLQSFANAERAAARVAGLEVIRGWAVYERLDRPRGQTFVAERYWWNALPDGTWVDFTPRSEACPELLLVEPQQGAPKSRSILSAPSAAFMGRLLQARFQGVAAAPGRAEPVAESPGPRAPLPERPAAAQQQPPPPSGQQHLGGPDAKAAASRPPRKAAAPDQAASVVDYSRWSRIEDSDDEATAGGAPSQPSRLPPRYGVKDLAEGRKLDQPADVPDYLVGQTGGGGSANCYTSICKLLDADQKKEGVDNSHQLAQAFGKIFRCGLLDRRRQRFYREALAAVASDAFVVVLGVGSVLPLLEVARRFPGRSLVLELSSRLAGLAQALLQANQLSMPAVAVKQGLDKEEPVREAIARHLPRDAARVVILTELFAHDLLSNGIVPASIAAHAAVRAVAPKAEVRHIPQSVELMATPLEVRSESLGGFDVRPFNAFRHTSSNDKADFWWWPVRLDNQPGTRVALLGPEVSLCGFDFERSPEIGLDEVRRSLKLRITSRGRCNAVALWWTARSGALEYSTRPSLAEPPAARKAEDIGRSEWKQAVHHLAGETAVFVGDELEVLASITPRFTVRMMQTSPFSVVAPPWVQAPTTAKLAATIPILPYHFLMMTDTHRLQVYGEAIRHAVRQQRARLGRRVRVLDAGCGIGLLGMTAAMEGADVWLCEAVPKMRHMCREVLAANAQVIAEKEGLVHLLPPMMSTSLKVGRDIAEKFDVVVSEVMDLWGLGEGVIPTMSHAYRELLADGGSLLPGHMVILVQPLELQLWAQPEREHKVNLGPLGAEFQAKFSPLRIEQVPHRFLTSEPCAALEIDLAAVPEQPSQGTPNLEGVNLCIRMGGKPALRAKISQMTIATSGMLCGYGIWWAADLGGGQVITSAPGSGQRSWKQLVRWLKEPRFVVEGEEVQVLACYNENQVNLEDICVPAGGVEHYKDLLRQGGGETATKPQQQQQPQRQAQQQQQPQPQQQQPRSLAAGGDQEAPGSRASGAAAREAASAAGAGEAAAVEDSGDEALEVD